MRSHHLFKCLLLCCSFAFLWTCGPKNDSISSTSKGLPLNSDLAKEELTDCTNACGFSFWEEFSITQECANCMMGNYRINGYKFQNSNISKSDSIRGFALQPLEVVELGKHVQFDSSTKIYSMGGIYYGASVLPQEKIVTAQLVLIAQSIDSTGRIIDKYFNFTQPCPTFCPLTPDTIVIPPIGI